MHGFTFSNINVFYEVSNLNENTFLKIQDKYHKLILMHLEMARVLFNILPGKSFNYFSPVTIALSHVLVPANLGGLLCFTLPQSFLFLWSDPANLMDDVPSAAQSNKGLLGDEISAERATILTHHPLMMDP